MPDQSEAGYLQHLGFIQTVVARQASNSFLLKGWTLTISGAFYGFSVAHSNWKLAIVGLLPPAFFWFLDTYYLRQERLFRCLYADVIKADGTVPPLSMVVSKYKLQSHKTRWYQVMFSITEWTFYCSLAVVGLLVALSAAHH